jgi:hypothetical protein
MTSLEEGLRRTYIWIETQLRAAGRITGGLVSQQGWG